MQSEAPEALLFDLGGVLIDIDFERALAFWSSFSSMPVKELRRSFSADAEYEAHERGELHEADYFDYLARKLKLNASQSQIREGWNSIFVAEISETRALVESLRGTVRCYAFTNTNATHMQAWSQRFPAVVRAFHRVFASHELGLRKPERAAFECICASIGVAAGRVLFFDDLPENVSAANESGLQAVLVRSPGDVSSALKSCALPRTVQ